MKKAFIILFFACMHFLGCANAKKEIHEDCTYLETILSQAYVNYDEAAEKNFNTDFLVKNIKSDYKKQFGVKNFNSQKFGLLVALHVTDYLGSLNIIDNHLTFANEDFDCSFFYQTYSYYSTIYFEKKDGRFVVFSSDNDEIKKGSVFTGNPDDFKITYGKNNVLYRYVVLSTESQPDIHISVNQKNVPCNVKRADIKSGGNISFQETDSSIYIRLPDCYLEIGNPQERQKALKEFNAVIEKIIKADTNKNVILDVRGNSGGYAEVIYRLLVPIFYRVRYESFPDFYYAVEKAQNGQYELHSTEINKAILRLEEERNAQNKITNVETERRLVQKTTDTKGLPQILNEKLAKKLYILIDSGTASAAEYGIAAAYLINKEKIVLVGDKSYGAMESGNWYSYTLPNSKLKINLATINHSKENLFACNEHWHGDTKGFYPDFWCADSVLENMQNLTGDFELGGF